jgi:hypothetical protein
MYIVSAMQHLSKAYEYTLNMQVERLSIENVLEADGVRIGEFI